MKHIVSTRDFSRDEAMHWIQLAEQLRHESRQQLRQRLPGAVVATLFYEPSTRTRLSFEAAVTRLGGRIIGAENARENSSAKKGESLEDVFRVVGSYVDAIVIRHHENDAIEHAVSFSPVPIISGGSGAEEHPTQALLDLYTIWREFGRLDDLELCVVGDLKYGRTVHSLLRALTYFSGIRLTLLHPASLGLPQPLIEELQASGLKLAVAESFEQALRHTDVVYQTRIQMERLGSLAEASEASQFVIRPEHLRYMQAHARIMHPLPRVDEIAAAVDADPRAAYFRQAENGLYMRMALLDDILGGIVR